MTTVDRQRDSLGIAAPICVYYGSTMATTHDLSTPAFAHAISEACRKLSGFEATQTIAAGPIRLVARIGLHRPDSLAVEYQTYENPLLDLEDRLTGDAEYVPDELAGLSLHFDGQRTWLHDTSTGVCVVRASRLLFEPLPEFALIGEIGYLRDLPHDYLLREREPETIDARQARVLALKPKRPHSTHAFKAVSFLASRATVAIDTETLFPLRLCFTPVRASHAHRVIGADGSITVSYSSVRLTSDAPSSFVPPEGTRVFHEDSLPVVELAGRLPFSLSLASFDDAQFVPFDGRALLVEDADNDRAYCTVPFVRRETGEDESAQFVTLRVGNYLSRNMARRRLAAAELGGELTVDGHTARVLDRRSLWEKHAPGIDSSQAPRELSFERGGIFGFLIGSGIEADELTQLATGLIGRSGDAEST